MAAGHGLQIVSVTNDHSFVLEEEVLEQLLLREDIKELPVVVVSVVGAFRSGKSFLLNFFLRYLSATPSAREDGSWLGEDSAPLVGFKWHSGIQAVTKGVLMWSEPFITELPSGEKAAILLVDTQGTFSGTTTVRENSSVFTISTLISSMQIYNTPTAIHEDDLFQLSMLTEYGNLVRNAHPNITALQGLNFLVRDWLFPYDFPYGADGGMLLLNDKLQIIPEFTTEMRKIRSNITSNFEKVTCFLMPHPGFKAVRRSFDGKISDLDLEFKTQIKHYVENIFKRENLIPKTIFGKQIRAKELMFYFKTYLELLSSPETPTPSRISEKTKKAFKMMIFQRASNIYENGMNAICGPSKLNLPEFELHMLHEYYLKLAKKHYLQEWSPFWHNDVFYKSSEEHKAINAKKILISHIRAKNAYDEVIYDIHKEQPLCVHPAELGKLHAAGLEAAIRIYDGRRHKISDDDDVERETFIKGFNGTYKKNRETNKKNNLNLVQNVLDEYTSKMQEKIAINPPLCDVDLKQDHENARQLALNDFKARRNVPDDSIDIYVLSLIEKIENKFQSLQPE